MAPLERGFPLLGGPILPSGLDMEISHLWLIRTQIRADPGLGGIVSFA